MWLESPYGNLFRERSRSSGSWGRGVPSARPMKIPAKVRRLGLPHHQSYSHRRLGSRFTSTEHTTLTPCHVWTTTQTAAGPCTGSRCAHRHERTPSADEPDADRDAISVTAKEKGLAHRRSMNAQFRDPWVFSVEVLTAYSHST